MEPPQEGGVWAQDYAMLCCLPCRFQPSVRERAWSSIVPFTHSEYAPCFQHTLHFLVGR